MAWTTTAPTLPNGSSWVQEQTTNFVANHWTLNTTRYIARLDGNSIAVKVVAVMSNGSYGTFYTPGKYHLSMTAGGQTVTDTTTYTMSKGTQIFYCVGVAEPGSTVSTTIGYMDSSSSRKVITFTAPAFLVITLNISFDSQNGTTCTAIVRNQNDPYGELPVSYRRGHEFLGWSTTKDGQVKYKPGEKYWIDRSGLSEKKVFHRVKFCRLLKSLAVGIYLFDVFHARAFYSKQVLLHLEHYLSIYMASVFSEQVIDFVHAPCG